MKSITAREANQAFSRYLAEAEAGEEITITRRGKPVATLSPHRLAMTPEKQAAIQRAIEMMRNAPNLPVRRITRDEIYDD